MEWRILFLGPVGSGKTQAVRTMSSIEVVGTEAAATDETRLLKNDTTVAMDMGVMELGGDDRVVLYGAPGQDRFDFMWEILLDQTKGLVLLLNHSAKNPLADLAHYIHRLRELCNSRPPALVVGVTHTDVERASSLDIYRNFLQNNASDFGGQRLPVLRVDARKKNDVRSMLLALTSMLEIEERFPRRNAR
jgi:signal recognition particle receptor subunit beta